MSFDRTWRVIRGSLREEQTVRNWTKDRGYYGDPFTIECLDANRIDVIPLRAKNIQGIPKRDFEGVYNIWDQYVAGNFPRSMIRDNTRFSKYIISIFHWVVQNNDGILL